MNGMNVYQYVAVNNPNFAKSLCHKYGYKVTHVRQPIDLGKCLEQLVTVEGEDALREILTNHPDKGVLVEMFSQKAPEQMHGADGSVSGGAGGCKCGGACSSKCPCGGSSQLRGEYMNANGLSEIHKTTAANQTNFVILASALIIAFALIGGNNKKAAA